MYKYHTFLCFPFGSIRIDPYPSRLFYNCTISPSANDAAKRIWWSMLYESIKCNNQNIRKHNKTVYILQEIYYNMLDKHLDSYLNWPMQWRRPDKSTVVILPNSPTAARPIEITRHYCWPNFVNLMVSLIHWDAILDFSPSCLENTTLKSMLVDKNVQTRLMVGCQHSRQPVRSRFSHFLSTNMSIRTIIDTGTISHT